MVSAGKKVLIIVENLPVPFDRRVWQEALALREAGYIVSIICPKNKTYNKSYEVSEDIYIYRHPLNIEANSALQYAAEYIIALFWETVLTFKIFLTRGFDIIHACNPPDLIFLLALPYKLIGKKFIFDHHDINPELYIAKYDRKDIFYKLLLFFERLSFKCADIVISTNESYKAIAVERGKKKKEDVFIVRSAPDLNKFKPVAPNEMHKNSRKYLVGYVGVIGNQEGLKYLVLACEFIVTAKNRQDIQFICVGDGPELNNIKTMTEEKDLDSYITFTGRVPDRDLIEILSTCDVCVNTDEFNEMNDKSTMNKIMEYMALGKPVVQFDLKEGRITAKNASLYAKKNDYVDMAEMLIELIDCSEIRMKMSKLGFDMARGELSWEYQKGILLNSYDNLMQLK